MRVAQNIVEVIARAEFEGNLVRLTGQLDRPTYQAINKVLDAAGGKWNRAAKAHVFAGDAYEALDSVFTTGEIAVPKDEFDFFPTPGWLAEQLVISARIVPGMRVLEPSCGEGAIVKAVLAADGDVDGFEVQPAKAERVRTDFGVSVVEADFLSMPPTAVYDRVVMNPPFQKQADIKHVMHALGFLKTAGRLVSVMGAGVTFRVDRRAVAFRDLLSKRGGTIEALPEGSFKSSGTMVNTVVVVIPGI